MRLDDRYHPTAWPKTSRRARQCTHHRCTHCLWRRADVTHHARYCAPLRGSLRGREIPGWDVFPLCAKCHGWAHRHVNWVESGDRESHHQRLGAWLQLVVGYQVRRVPWEALLLTAFLAAIAGFMLAIVYPETAAALGDLTVKLWRWIRKG